MAQKPTTQPSLNILERLILRVSSFLSGQEESHSTVSTDASSQTNTNTSDPDKKERSKGRVVIVEAIEIPGTDGNAHDYITDHTFEYEPIDPDIEKTWRESAKTQDEQRLVQKHIDKVTGRGG